MTRKWLSGVLAFAMVFGCTAPVAMAEETPTDVVEQYALVDYQLSKTTVEFVEGDTTAQMVTLTGYADPSTTAAKVETVTSDNFTVSDSLKTAGYLVITPKSGAKPNGDGEKVTITITNTGTDGAVTTITRELTVKVKSATGDITYQPLELQYDLTVAKDATNSLKLTQTGTNSYDGSTVTYDAKITEVRVMESAKEFMEASYSGNTITVKGLKETASIAKALKVTAVDAAGATKTAYVNVEISARKDVKYKWVAATTNAKADATGKYMAQAYRINEYGEEVAYDAGQSVDWYVNDTKLEIGETLKDADAVELLKLAAHSDYPGRDAAKNIDFYMPGTYTITLKAANTDNVLLSTTVTVGLADVENTDIVLRNANNVKELQLGREYTLASVFDWALKTEINGKEYLILDEEDRVSGYRKGDGIINPEYTITASLTTGTQSVKDAFNQYITIDNGTIKIANNDTTKAQKGKTITVTIKAASGAKKTAEIGIMEYKKLDYIIELYDGTTKVNDKVIAMKAGETKTLSYKVIDEASGNVLGNVQDVAWDIDGSNADDEKIASIDQNGTITALRAGVAEVGVVATDLAEPAFVTIVVTGTAPTEKPTETPTQKPETLTGKVVTKSSALNIRAAATTSSAIVAKAAKGSTVTILGEEGDFYKVQLANGTIGYASKAYISVTTTPVDPAPVTGTATTTANLRLRKSASTKSSIVTTMPKGSTVTVLEKGSEWSKVEYNGKTGYASNGYLTFNTIG